MKWFFTPQLASQVETEVTQRDQFSNDEVQLSETIIRESIQNSLDAADDQSNVVKVTFRWVDQSGGLDGKFLCSILKEQLIHAREAGLDIDSIDFSNPSALVIEDFGTCGLTGSINEKDEDNFSDFWRRHGKSHKTGKSRGRWGLGKLVYPTSSRVGVFFGATLRNGDPELHIMGQTVLNLRTVEGKEYPPHGFFADTEGDSLFNQIPVPLKDKNLVEQFTRNFRLSRENQPGLSVIIPFPNPDFSVEHMISDAINNYFYPLITGQLILQFNDTKINSANVRELAHKYTSSNFRDIDTLFDFIEEATKADKSILLKMKPSWVNDHKLDENDFDENVLASIRQKFAEGQMVALNLPVTIKKKNGTPHPTSFSVFLKCPENLQKGLDLYVRGGLTLPGEAKFRERRALGIVIAEEEAICAFLGDAENAAHTHWIGSAEKLKKNYMNPGKTVRVIKHSLVQLYDLLAGVVEEIDEQALQEFFGIEEPEKGTRARKKKKKTPIEIPPLPKPRPKDFTINKIDDGFSITTTDSTSKDRFPQNIRIDVAYDIATGNPFKKYNPLDFKLGKNSGIKLEWTPDKVIIRSARENSIRLEVTDIPFKLNVRGFDKNRDLKVRLVKEN